MSMRLTLRALLAYMDGILPAQDAELIGEKVEQSPVAQNLMGRIRDVSSRLRLPAPELEHREQQLDSNTVAEYLDNVLSAERVHDFEHVCFESDMHLAEVASCHQILAIVLDQPVEINLDARHRIYGLPNLLQSDAITLSDDVIAESANGNGRGGKSTAVAESQETPAEPPIENESVTTTASMRHDYLEDSPASRSGRAALIGLAACVCLALVLFLTGQFKRDSAMMTFLFDKPVDQPAEPGDQEPGEGTIVDNDVPVVDPAPIIDPADPAIVDPPIVVAPVPVPHEPIEDPVPPIVDPATEPPIENPTVDIVEPAIPVVDNPPGESTIEINPEPVIVNPADPIASDASDVDPPAEPVLPEPVVPAEPMKMATFVSPNQILIRRVPAGNGQSWQRVEERQTVYSTERLVALPAFRPKLQFPSGLSVEMMAGTKLDLIAPDQFKIPGAEVSYGRLLLGSTSDSAVGLLVKAGQISGYVVLVKAGTQVAVDVQCHMTPSLSPGRPDVSYTVQLYLVGAGEARWTPPGTTDNPIALAPGRPLAITETAPPASLPLAGIPEWIQGPSTSDPLEIRASIRMLNDLTPDVSVGMRLVELTQDRQVEVQQLAKKMSGHVGEFKALISVLNNPEYRLDWPDYIAELTAAIKRDPETADAVRKTFEQLHARDASFLYRMLMGFTVDDLKAGEAERLVDGLESEVLAVRVLSYLNLKRLTGLGINYKPEDSQIKRQQAMRYWRDRLESGELIRKAVEQAAKG